MWEGIQIYENDHYLRSLSFSGFFVCLFVCFKICLFILFVLGHHCAQVFSASDEGELFFAACSSWASRCHGFSCCRALALGMWASVMAVHGLNSCDT